MQGARHDDLQNSDAPFCHLRMTAVTGAWATKNPAIGGVFVVRIAQRSPAADTAAVGIAEEAGWAEAGAWRRSAVHRAATAIGAAGIAGAAALSDLDHACRVCSAQRSHRHCAGGTDAPDADGKQGC